MAEAIWEQVHWTSQRLSSNAGTPGLCFISLCLFVCFTIKDLLIYFKDREGGGGGGRRQGQRDRKILHLLIKCPHQLCLGQEPGTLLSRHARDSSTVEEPYAPWPLRRSVNFPEGRWRAGTQIQDIGIPSSSLAYSTMHVSKGLV